MALPVLERVEIEPSQEEEDASALVIEIAEAACGGLEGLDGGVERLGHPARRGGGCDTSWREEFMQHLHGRLRLVVQAGLLVLDFAVGVEHGDDV